MDLGLVRLLCFGLRFFAEAPECQSTANVPKQQSRRECERLCTLLSKVLMPSVGDVAKSSVVPCFNRRDPIQPRLVDAGGDRPLAGRALTKRHGLEKERMPY